MFLFVDTEFRDCQNGTRPSPPRIERFIGLFCAIKALKGSELFYSVEASTPCLFYSHVDFEHLRTVISCVNTDEAYKIFCKISYKNMQDSVSDAQVFLPFESI